MCDAPTPPVEEVKMGSANMIMNNDCLQAALAAMAACSHCHTNGSIMGAHH